jgi:tetratricopeptide (TPR) repeat protein
MAVAAPAFAQSDGVIAGRVVDTDGQPIAGATVSIYSPDRGDTRDLVTNADGDFMGRGFRTDVFVITFTADGFEGLRRELKVNFGMNTVDATLGRAVAPSNVEYDDINEYYQVGFAAYEAQDWVGARDAMAALIAAIEGMAGDEVDVMRASSLEILGRAQLETGDVDGALATYDQLLAVNPDSVPAHFWKSEGHVRAQDYDAALPHVRRAAELAPDDATMQYNVGVILLQIGEVKEGIATLERTVALLPDFPMARKQLGYAYLQLGGEDPTYYGKALAELRAYLEVSPDAADKADVEGLIAALEAQIQG